MNTSRTAIARQWNWQMLLHVLMASLLLLPSSPATAHAESSQDQATVFVDVDVVPMDGDRLLEHQTVIVRGEVIERIGDVATIPTPANARVIEGKGLTLMPGLADMHTHLASQVAPFEGPGQLLLYLTEGVTTIRALSGLPEHTHWRDQVARGELVGPSILLSGPNIVGMPDFAAPMRYLFMGKVAALGLAVALVVWLVAWALLRRRGTHLSKLRTLIPALLGGALLGALSVAVDVVSFRAELQRTYPGVTIVETVEEGRAEVRRQKAAGFDLVKPYDYSEPEVYEAIVDEADKNGMYSVGHLPAHVTPREAFAAGLDEIAHVDELMETHMSGEASPNSGFAEVTFDYATIPETAKAVKEHDAMVVSNLVADETAYRLLEDVAGQLSLPRYRVVKPATLESWKTEGRAVDWQGQQEWRRNTLQPFLKAMVKALHEAGVRLLVGTDVSVEGIVPSHLHRDLELLVDAGLTPYQALEAGTKNAALSVARAGGDGNFGAVQVGKLADLILVEGNPLKDVSVTQRRAGVMKRGRWYSQEELDGLVAAYVAQLAGL